MMRPTRAAARLLGAVALALPAASAAQVSPPPPAPVVAPAPSAGWLGFRSTMTVRVDDGVPSTASHLRITEVFGEGPAARAGLRPGDVVVGLNGAPVGGERFQSLARRLHPGDPVTLSVLREGRRMEVALIAAARPPLETLVPLQLQEALDSTHRIFEARLDSVRFFPHIEVRRIEADRVEEVSVRVEGGTRRMEVRTPDGVFEWVVDRARSGSPGPSAFRAWAFRSDGKEAEDSLRVVVRAIPPAGGRGVAAAPTPPRASVPVEPPAANSTVAVRPLAPYLAGLNRVAGAEFTPLTGDLATYFQVGSGLLVTDVAEGTPAADAGLVPGDVIVDARDRPVDSVEALRSALSLRDGPLSLGVVRRGLRVEVRLPR